MSFLSVAFYFLLLLSTLLYFYLRNKFFYFKNQKIPFSTPKWPFGNLNGEIPLFESIHKVYNECKGKDIICGFYNLIQPVYFVLDESLIKTLIIKDFNNFVNRGMYLNEKDEPIAAHIFLVESDRWRFLRNKLTPAFTSGKLKQIFPTVSQFTSTLIDVIQNKMKNPIEIRHLSSQYTNDIISSVSFGMEAKLLDDENEELHELFKALTPFSENIFKFFAATIFPKFSKMIHLIFQEKKAAERFTEILINNIKYREETNDNRKDFLNMLIQLKNKGSIDGELSSNVKKLTLNEVIAQAYFFFFAGADTSSVTISWALAELSRNEDVQEKLRKEIEEKSFNEEITYEALHEMKYLGQVVDETLRMYTPCFAFFRKAENDYKVPNSSHIIPKGSAVWIPSIGFHYDERYWPNPKKFDPERFTQEEIEKRSPYVYLPFGEGPRNCIGMRFALINVRLAIATVIKNFKLTMDPKTIYPFKYKLNCPNMDAEGGFWINFKKR